MFGKCSIYVRPRLHRCSIIIWSIDVRSMCGRSSNDVRSMSDSDDGSDDDVDDGENEHVMAIIMTDYDGDGDDFGVDDGDDNTY